MAKQFSLFSSHGKRDLPTLKQPGTLGMLPSVNAPRLMPLAQLLRTQHAWLLAGAALVLGGAGAGAYAVAQAQSAQADVFNQLTLVTEEVRHGAQASGEQLAAPEFMLYRTDVVRSGESNASLLRRLGVVDAEALRFVNKDARAKTLSSYVGRTVQVQTTTQGQLQSLLLRYPQGDDVRFTRLFIERDAQEQLQVREETGFLQPQARTAYATIRQTFYGAMDEADVPDSVSAQLVEIFASEIDFHRSLKRGDSFKLVYETLQADGETMGTGRLLGASFNNREDLYEAVWFEAPDSAGTMKGGYYTLEGESLRKAYLASPLAYSRITSGFGIRKHPIWHQMLEHKGVDYGAPTGTPIMSVADGTVVFAGWQGGYGNAVEVRHYNGRSTFYAHMSRMSVRVGQKIAQGQVLGAVGSTGNSTGPHLHFEFRVGGQYQDPALMAKETGTVPLNRQARREFVQVAETMRKQLDNAREIKLAARG